MGFFARKRDKTPDADGSAEPTKKRGGWFSSSRRASLDAAPPAPPTEFKQAGTNTTMAVMDEAGLLRAMHVHRFANKLDIRRRMFGFWMQGVRIRQRERFQYVGEQMLELKQRDYETRLMDLVRERDGLRRRVEELERERSGRE